MELIPITTIKISKDKWLNTPIKYEEDYYIKDVIELIFQKTYQWVHSKNDIELITDYETFKSNFINCIYNKYV